MNDTKVAGQGSSFEIKKNLFRVKMGKLKNTI